METKSSTPEKKAYHTPELTSFGNVQQETQMERNGPATDNGTPTYGTNYTTAS